MDDLKKIMYGVTDFARMRAENAYFVDRTDLIRELEKTSYTVFLRPRRFPVARSSSAVCWSSSTVARSSSARRFRRFG